MGESERFRERRSAKRLLLGSDNNNLVWLLAINMSFFLLMLFIQVGYNVGGSSTAIFNNQVLQWFGVSGNALTTLERPWTLLTNGFMDAGGAVLRFLSNMIWLWTFGSILQNLSVNNRIIPIYIYGVLSGALVFLAANYIFPNVALYRDENLLLGASTGVMALAGACLALNYDLRFFRNIGSGIPLWAIVAVYLLIDLYGIAFEPSRMAAHVFAAATGYFFIVLLRKGTDAGAWMEKFYFFISNVFMPREYKTQPKEHLFYNAGGRKPYTKKAVVTQSRVDEILDKINERGYHSLNDQEKEILKKASESDDLR